LVNPKRGGVFFDKFIDLMKFQITNHKKQTNHNDQKQLSTKSQMTNYKQLRMTKKQGQKWKQPQAKHRLVWNLVLEIWNLFVIWCLKFVILEKHSKAEPTISDLAQRTRLFNTG